MEIFWCIFNRDESLADLFHVRDVELLGKHIQMLVSVHHYTAGKHVTVIR